MWDTSLVIMCSADDPDHQATKDKAEIETRARQTRGERPVLSVLLVLVVIDGARSLLLPVLTIEYVL